MIKKPASLSASLHRYIGTIDESRILDDFLHISDLYNMCSRQVFLAKKEKIKVQRPIDPASRMRFTMGIAVEDTVRNWLEEMGDLSAVKPEVKDENLKIQGHPDGRLNNGQLLEIKGMDPALFKLAAKYPLAKHKLQVEAYLGLDKDNKSGILLQITWGQGKNPFNDHLINYNLKTWEIVKREVSILREAEAGGQVPHRICQSENDRRAVICPVRYQCFNLKSDATTKTIGEILKEKT